MKREICIPGVTEVFFWNGAGEIVYGFVHDKFKLEDGTVILTLRLLGQANKTATLPASAVAIIPSTQDYNPQETKFMMPLFAVNSVLLLARNRLACRAELQYRGGQNGRESITVGSQRWLFAVITVPFTILVFAIWVMWPKYHNKMHSKKLGNGELKDFITTGNM
ncbi:hypothetical protein M413DRAFT_12503 [Hebeloma cylindrosporum]|uniref:Uncharacterized protein n=1 Tax=Hebeloma cylindrosporum TaxID=76867 RepID=A0A0C3C3L9_HEBCY|nr:hypothetical protein M413DRAFT_12503 [Hebeloma cylindrosporum h7]